MSDLIDRQALKAAHGLGTDCADCKRDARSCQYDRDFSRMDFCEWIDDAPTASPWRRVEDGLPEKDKWVLTITKSYKGARIYNIATVDSDGRWWTPSQNGMREIHYIEYWMPIEPPKEDADGNK